MNCKAIYFISFICTLNKVNLVCVIASLDNSISFFFLKRKKIVMWFFEWLSCHTKTFKSVSLSLIRKMDFNKVFLNVWCGLTIVIFSSLKPQSMFDWESFNDDNTLWHLFIEMWSPEAISKYQILFINNVVSGFLKIYLVGVNEVKYNISLLKTVSKCIDDLIIVPKVKYFVKLKFCWHANKSLL